MALQFILGGSGSGKSHHLYKTVIEESGRNPGLNYMVLVPEQFTMQTQKDLVLMHEKKGIMNIDVLSFGRLAYRIFEETGKGNTPVLDDEGKNLILRRIAGTCESNLKVLRGNMKKLGYISEVKSVLSEFTQYDIGSDEIERVMKQAGEESYLYYKLQDILVLQKGFQEYLKDKFITKEEVLDVLCEVAEESELLKRSCIVLDGFTGFTPVQNRLLAKLMKLCLDVRITVTIDERENPYVYQHPYQLFGMSKKTVSSLIAIAKKEGVEIKEPVWMKEKPFFRFREEPALAWLESSLFRYTGDSYTKEQKAVVIHEATNPGEEAMAAAGEVRRLVRTEGYRYREIGVIVTDMNTYGEYLERAFLQYGIPIFMDHKRSILLNSFVEYLRSLLAMVEQGFTYDSVFRFLRSGYFPFEHEKLDTLDNYVLGLGIRGYKKWQEKWVRLLPGMKEEDLDSVNHLRRQLVEKLDGLVFVLRQRRKTVRDITEALYDFLVAEGMQQTLKVQEDAFLERGELALAKEYAQIYGIVMGLFDKFVELLGEEQVSLKEYCDMLDAGLNEAKVGVIPPGMDQVVVGDMQRTRLRDIKALLFLGANDVYLPGALMRTGLLGERDREKFQKEKISLTPGGKEQAYVQKFYLYLNLTKPTRKLHIYYSRVSSGGKSLRPSYLVQEIRRIFPNLSVVDESQKTLREKEISENTAVADLIEGLRMRSEKSGSAWMELYSWYQRKPDWAGRIAAILDAGFYHRPVDEISEAAARQLYGEHFENSITRMERFSACAFAHFLTYGLALKERQEFEFQAVDMGNVFHKAIEYYSRKLEKEGRGWTEISEEEQKKYVSESLELAIADYGNSVLYSSFRNEHMITRMKRVMERTVWALTNQLERGDFKPSAYELRFGSGKIDRVDTCVDGDQVYVKVLDYKTGMKEFDISALYHGLQLQLMVYMNAAVNAAQQWYPQKDVIPAGVFYYRIRDPFVEKTKDEGQREKMILKELRPDGIVNLDQESLRHLDRSMAGDNAGESLAIPVKLKKGGGLAKTSKAVRSEEFETMSAYAGEKVEQLHRQILEGDVSVMPYRMGNKTGCDYCGYRHICGFDQHIPGYGYRNISKLSREEAIAKMRQDTGREEVQS